MQDDRIRIVREETIADNYFELKKITYAQRRRDGSWQEETREIYDNASGAAILLYNRKKHTVLLTRQFRLGARLAGHDGYLIEVPAGMLDDADPEQRVRAELCEEAGFAVGPVRKVLTLFANPASLTERVHYFLGEYDERDRTAEGGGKEEEGEDIEVLEMDFDEALRQVKDGGIVDAKTVILLQLLRGELH
jgi:ADP-ribose pyrophosphatase